MKKQNKKMIMMDERQRSISQKAMIFAYIFLVGCLVVATTVRIILTENIGWEFFAIVGSCVVISISERIMGSVEQPLDYRNRPLPTGKSAADRWARCKNYAVGSSIFGLAFAAVDVLLMLLSEHEVSEWELTQVIFPSLGKVETIIVTAIITFVGMFAISFIFDYVIGEFYKVRTYNKKMAQLDAEENDELNCDNE